MSLSAGTLLREGRYIVVREVNRGGSAVVYEGEDTSTGLKVALKVMGLKDGRAAHLRGVRREVEYAASIAHPNVVRLLDFFAEEARLVIVWELIEGPDLLDLLNERGGRLDEASTRAYFLQLLEAVTFMHANGLVHRDLKPENCCIERATNRLKVIDFGLSKHQASAVTLGVGTPDYLAPELLGTSGLHCLHERRTGEYDAYATDVWALGVLLTLLVSGSYPFEDPTQPGNVVATLHNIAAGRSRPLPRFVSPACADLIAAMLLRDPVRRITLAEIGRHPWMAAQPQAGPSAAPCPSPPSAAAAEEPAAAEASGMDIDANPSSCIPAAPGAEPHRPTFSFDYPEAKLARGKTPATPRVITLAASSGAQGPRQQMPFTRAGKSDGRDLVVPVTPPAPRDSGTPAGQEARRAKVSSGGGGGMGGLGGLCRLWFG